MIENIEEITTESSQEGQERPKVKCIDCIYLVQTRHFLSKQILGYHCFSIGRQQEYPDQYNFDAAEIKEDISCEWFESIDSAHGSRTDEYAPKIQRFVTIRVRWGYDWVKAETSDEEEVEG